MYINTLSAPDVLCNFTSVIRDSENAKRYLGNIITLLNFVSDIKWLKEICFKLGIILVFVIY